MDEERSEQGILPPKVITERNIRLLTLWNPSRVEDHPLMKPFRHPPENLEEQDLQELRSQVSEILIQEVIPAYRELIQYTEGKYLKACPDEIGVSFIPDGKAFYENRVRHFTTLRIHPDSIMELGKAEVERIYGKMVKIIDELEYQGDYQSFMDFLKTDPRFFPSSPEDLLEKAAWLSKKAEGQLPRYFNTLYSLPFTIEPVPEEIAPNYTAGRFVHGNKEQGRPGIYWVNTYDLKSRTLYTLPALTLHEAVPGHHLQNAIASELTGIPVFRNAYYISAFGEGWGLYSEYLGEEMGMYTTPYEWFGRYTYEMWRACRLVVDVGMHYKGWTREQAVEYMSKYTALSDHEINSEIDRYIGWPGQALSYKMGEITIKHLRAHAEQQLGEAFDIREFHDHLLKNGSVPLPVLEHVILMYVDEVKKRRDP